MAHLLFCYEEPETFKALMQTITDYRVKMIPLIFTPCLSNPALAASMMEYYFQHRDEYNPYRKG